MKKLFIATLILAGMATYAQEENNNQQKFREQRERLTPEQRDERQLKKITTELDLTAAQQEQVKSFIAEKNAKRQQLMASRSGQKKGVSKLTAEQKEAFKKERQAEREANEAKMKSILTPEQYETWHANQQRDKKAAVSKMEKRRNK
jgi:protein CpxP